jgi:hypothetical protein
LYVAFAAHASALFDDCRQAILKPESQIVGLDPEHLLAQSLEQEILL